jgi:hypothetical protein
MCLVAGDSDIVTCDFCASGAGDLDFFAGDLDGDRSIDLLGDASRGGILDLVTRDFATLFENVTARLVAAFFFNGALP